MTSMIKILEKIRLPAQPEYLESCSRTWMMLNTQMPKLTEEQLLQLMKLERARKEGPRKHMLVRLHQRYSALRSHREKTELGIVKERRKA